MKRIIGSIKKHNQPWHILLFIHIFGTSIIILNAVLWRQVGDWDKFLWCIAAIPIFNMLLLLGKSIAWQVFEDGEDKEYAIKEGKMNCEKCPWRHPDTCKECKAQEKEGK